MIRIESPLIREILTENTTQTMQQNILQVLEGRLGSVPEDLAARIGAIKAKPKLDKLLLLAATCPDLETFRAQLPSAAKRRRASGRRKTGT